MLTSWYSLFCCWGCFMTRFGFLFHVTEQPKETTGSLTRPSNSTKLTEKEIGNINSIWFALLDVLNFILIELILLCCRDDQIVFNGLIFYIVRMLIPPSYSNLPFWRSDGVILTILMHMGPVEFFYYWFHRALHHHYLYSRYHSHHHSSIVTEPITCQY